MLTLILMESKSVLKKIVTVEFKIGVTEKHYLVVNSPGL